MNWHFWVDRGGTFTDVVARAGDGTFHRLKLLSSNPGRYADAAVEAMRRITRTPEGPLPQAQLRIGTTVATNALLERKGEPVLLAITHGFRDALSIGSQERPDIFARHIRKPGPLYSDVVEIAERVTADGKILEPLDEAEAQAKLEAAFERGFRAIAIVLMHGYRFTAHERALAEIAARIGFTRISASHLVAPLIKLIPRGETSVIDAYLSPVVQDYVRGLREGIGTDVDAMFMQSSGGLTEGATFHGKDAILSGPAGGIVGMAATAHEAGFDRVIGFDMGGTSTDVSHYSGSYERDSETRIAGVRIRTPMMRIHTVAAGGGSICHFDGARFLVGQESAGAVPGPACYRRGGPLTITDCNLILGKLQPGHFPHVFGPDGKLPPDRKAAVGRMQELLREIEAASGQSYLPEQAAEGFLAIAVANMANAIKTISLRRGHDVTRATLVSFGGAGGQHACLVADALGIDTVMCHPLASVLSAYGMGLADRRAVRERTLAVPLEPSQMGAIVEASQTLCGDAQAELAAQGRDTGATRIDAQLFIRPEGADNTIEVPLDDIDAMRSSFRKGWQARFGFAPEGALVAETLRVEAIAQDRHGARFTAALPPQSTPPIEQAEIYCAGKRHLAPLYRRETLAEGFTQAGPAMVVDEVSTVVVEPGWTAQIDRIGNLILSRAGDRPATRKTGDTARDPVRLEIMGALFMAIAEEMGAALQFSARSVNIRERLDFSCAIFDRHGNLVANAPHMPVHLGSMGESVRTVIARRGRETDGRGMLPGDAYALNAPYDGGTHLPDITVVMPIFVDPGDVTPAWFVAARGHHADIGGIAPGSMPPASRTLSEEGVVLDNVLLVNQGRFCEAELRAALAAGPWPARNPDRNLDDLKAQVAACAKGAGELRRIAAEQGREVVDAYMGHVQDQAEEAVRTLIGHLSGGRFRCPMDNGAEVIVNIALDGDKGEAVIDFTGSSPQLGDNFNAPLPVVRAAVLYVVRTLIDEAVPMNEGCLRPLKIVVPEGSMLHPRPPAAVVAGNVETSQVITDALFGALGAMAAAQGTMNNFTFGNDRYQYYETIAGGSGGGPGFPGADAVQTHMTNSRLTDPEVLESEFPVLLEEFSIREDSGGQGANPGGRGIVRSIRFFEQMEASILSNRRTTEPFGLAGGEPGMRGRNRIERADGTSQILDACAGLTVGPGDRMIIETPGGGGYGKKMR